MEDKNLFIVPGMPFKDFPKAPEDHSPSTLVTCKHCGNKMWLSEKKKHIIMERPDAFIACWNCIMEITKKGEMKCDKLISVHI